MLSKPMWRAVCGAALAAGMLQAAQDRIQGPADTAHLRPAPGRVHPLARAEYDRGAANASMPLSYVTLYFKLDSSVEQFLDELQMPSSPNYHKWLTPGQFGQRFGLSDADASKVAAWLQAEGLKIHDVARGRHWVTFSGTAASVGKALRTSFRRYEVNGKMHYANVAQPMIPAAFEPVVAGFGGLDDFGPESQAISAPVASPDYNIGTNHYLAPDDFATIYDVAALYGAGIDATGQSIAILGESDISLADLHAFRSKFGLAQNDPQIMLVGPDPGTNGNEIEADLDLQWSAAVARNANIIYVNARSINTAAEYAVDQNLAPIMSESFGGCEQYNSPILRAVAQQANAQGITWIAASGDAGATTCDRSAIGRLATHGLSVSFPASIPEITALGGTSFNDSGGTYWAAANSPTLASALSYIPEQAWNDSRTGFASTGGGASSYFAKPLWQTGPGVPADGARDLPDISLNSSGHTPYYVISEGKAYGVSGTSASTPTFAGMLALLTQHLAAGGPQQGLGNINPALYRLAQATKDVFHDVAAGDNQEPCEQGSPACVNGLAGYSAGPAYDQTTGIGTVDAYNFVMEWGTGSPTSTALSVSPSSALPSDTVQLTASVSAGGVAPTGNVDFVINVNGTSIDLGTAVLAGTGATATATLSVTGGTLALAQGSVSALYGGDGAFAGSSGSATAQIVPAANAGSFVVPLVTPNPTPEVLGSFPYTVSLTEIAGVATTLTGFTVNGVTQNLSLWTSNKIPANGTVSAALSGAVATVPLNRTFIFTGQDADGRMWTQQITVPFISPLLPGTPAVAPGIVISSVTGGTVAYDSQAPASCQWYLPLTVRETGGYYLLLSTLRTSQGDISSQIQSIFGTTHLAPYGSLSGYLCFAAAGAPVTVTVIGTIEDSSLSGTVSFITPASTFAPASTTDAVALSVAPQTVALDQTSSTAPVTLDFGGASVAWTATVMQGSSTAQWLTLSSSAGTGAGSITLKASATGLSPGAYNATIGIYAQGASPAVAYVPVRFVVGSSPQVTITGLQNAFSFQSAFAPGMSMSVYGTNLAAGTQTASSLPLPLTMQGVSVTVNGITAPLYYASPGQLNVQIPYETGAGPTVIAVNRGGQVAAFSFTVNETAPGLFSSAIDNSTGLPVSSAATGSVLLLFMTGEGDTTPFLVTGATPSSAITNPSALPKPRLAVTVTVGGVPAKVLFAGIASGLVGVTQIDIMSPDGVPSGPQDVVVTVGGVAAPAIKLAIAAPSQ